MQSLKINLSITPSLIQALQETWIHDVQILIPFTSTTFFAVFFDMTLIKKNRNMLWV
jgi:hypothetical protein